MKQFLHTAGLIIVYERPHAIISAVTVTVESYSISAVLLINFFIIRAGCKQIVGYQLEAENDRNILFEQPRHF